jgi:phosphoribosyl-AMP cyclohydrolase
MGSLPSIQEVEEMLNTHRRNHEALMHLRSAVLSQEYAMAEQMAQRKVFKAGGLHYNDRIAMYQEFKSNRGSYWPRFRKTAWCTFLPAR